MIDLHPATVDSKSDQPKLTNCLLLSLSDQFSIEDQLRKFGVVGLGLSKTVIGREMQNNPRNIQGAAYKVLEHWWKCHQEDESKAYDAICDALKKVEMYGILRDWQKGS